jgi:hypothetical protein
MAKHDVTIVRFGRLLTIVCVRHNGDYINVLIRF